MVTEPAGASLRALSGPSATELADRQLLDRFVGAGDEAAFAELVRRYGPTVWSVCGRFLPQEQDAEDAFQAVFFLLARKAASIRKGEAVGSWLYGVACRIAMRSRRGADRRQAREQRAPGAMPEHEPWSQAACRELQRLLDEEVEALPDKYRAPFVLCCLEGMSRAEAAKELGWKEGTLSSRLAQARKRLETRLARRGVTLSAALTASVLALNAASAAPPALAPTTTAAVLAALTGDVSAPALTPAAVALAETFLSGTALLQLKTTLLLLLALLTLAAGPGVAALLTLEQDEPNAPAPPAAPGAVTVEIDEQVLALAFSPDGKKLVTAGARHLQPGQFKVWDVATRENLVRVRGVPGIRAVAYAPDGRSIATGVFGGALILRDPATGQEQARAVGHDMGVNSLAYSADGQRLATAGLDHVVKLWDVQGLRERKAFHGHTDMVFAVAYFRHGRAIVSGGQDRTARLWDLEAGKEAFSLTGHRAPIEAIAIAPDDKIVATGSWDRTIKFWDAATGQETATLPVHDSSILSLAFSPDGKLLACGTSSGKVCLWDVETRTLVADLGRHVNNVWTLAFSHDGALLASGSSDRTAKLWDLGDRKEVASLMTAEGPAPALAVPAQDGKPRGAVEPANVVQVAPAEPAAPRAGRRLWLLSVLGLLLPLALFALVLRRAKPEPKATDVPAGFFRFPCSHCAKLLRARTEHVGKEVRCPHCRETIAVPAPPAADVPAAPGPSRFTLSRRRRVFSGLLLLGLVVLGGLVAVLYQPPRVPLVNAVVGNEFRADVEESGFHAQQYDKQDKPYRWTNGAARLTIPIDPQDPPRAVRLRLWAWRPPKVEPAQVRIAVNQRELCNERLSRDVWERTLELDGIDLGSAVVLELVSDTFLPAEFDGGSDRRRIGVQVRGIKLLHRGDEPAN